jgi:hypothetical protein
LEFFGFIFIFETSNDWFQLKINPKN